MIVSIDLDNPRPNANEEQTRRAIKHLPDAVLTLPFEGLCFAVAATLSEWDLDLDTHVLDKVLMEFDK